LSEKDLNKAISLVKAHQTELIEAFYKVKDGQKIKTIKLK
jgi:hypothetical protein